VDRTRARCSVEVGFDKKTKLPDSVVMTVLIGRRNEHGRTAKGDAAFGEGVEHIVFTYDYKIDTDSKVKVFSLPREARSLLK
jgi:hypothetical protein